MLNEILDAFDLGQTTKAAQGLAVRTPITGEVIARVRHFIPEEE